MSALQFVIDACNNVINQAKQRGEDVFGVVETQLTEFKQTNQIGAWEMEKMLNGNGATVQVWDNASIGNQQPTITFSLSWYQTAEQAVKDIQPVPPEVKMTLTCYWFGCDYTDGAPHDPPEQPWCKRCRNTDWWPGQFEIWRQDFWKLVCKIVGHQEGKPMGGVPIQDEDCYNCPRCGEEL